MKLIDFLPNEDNYRPVLDTDTNEKLWRRIRNWRDVELKKSDWTQLSDAPIDQAAWAEYRQWLRDLPQNSNNPREIDIIERP